MSKWCDLIRYNNYDVGKMLSKLPNEIQNIFRELCVSESLYKYKKSANLPAITCIKNYYQGVKLNSDYISGVGKICYMKSSDDKNMKRVYIMYDYTHSLEESCDKKLSDKSMDVTDYLTTFFNNSPLFVDFYCEYEKHIRFIDDSHLKRIEDKFRHCSEGVVSRSNSRVCPPNVRIHFGDIRALDKDLKDIFKDHRKKFDRFEYIRELDLYLDRLTSKEKFNKYMVENITKNKMIKKQIKKTDPVMVGKILEFAYSYYYIFAINTINSYSKGGYRFFNHVVRVYSDMILDNTSVINMMKHPLYNDYFYLLCLGSSYIMDIYLLCRMFKKMDTKNSHDPEYARNIIIYAGSAHSNAYKNFLTSIGYTTEYIRKFTPTISCLNISDLKQPLFSD
jgi:hypothetical protein